MTFQLKLEHIVKKNNSIVCVGLDTDISNLPRVFKHQKNPQFKFNQFIIRETYDLVCAYKLNSAFYEARGHQGIKELKMTCDYLRDKYPKTIIILDAKRGDVANTNKAYTQYIFDYLGVDAVTLNPYFGHEALEPFLKRDDKGAIIICRTSNPGGGEIQDLFINGKPLYKLIAKKVVSSWNRNHNCLLVVGATYPKELAEIRRIAHKITFLIPGVGTQGAELETTVKAGQNKQGAGMIINSSRGIIFANNPKKETIKLRNSINTFRKWKN